MLPLRLGWATSFSRLGPAEVVKLMPIPRIRRPTMNSVRPGDAACRIDPATERSDPANSVERLPKVSAGHEAKRAPITPPMKTMAVMRPRISSEGLSMSVCETLSVYTPKLWDAQLLQNLLTLYPVVHGLEAPHNNFIVADYHLRDQDAALPKDQATKTRLFPPWYMPARG